MDKWLRNVNVVRVAALLIGILLWVIVHLDEHVGEDKTVVKDTPVDNWIYDLAVVPLNLDEEKYKIVSVSPETVNIIIRGKSQDLAQVSTKDGNSRIVADLSDARPGSNKLQLHPQGFPDRVQVVSIHPNTVDVVIEEIQRKEVPVAIDFIGEPAVGYSVGEPIINPNRVHISAPQSMLASIDSVKAKVDVTNADSAVKGEYPLIAYTNDGRIVDVSIVPATVNVEVPVTVPYKTIPLQIRLQGQPPKGYSVAGYKQSVNTVTIYGPEEALNAIDVYDALEIDLSQVTESLDQTMPLPLPDGVEKIHPESVDIVIDIVQSVTRTIPDVQVQLSGLNDDFEMVFVGEDEGRVDVTVEGAPGQVAGLSAEQIQAVIDVSNLPPGPHEVDVKINLPVFMKLSGTTPPRIVIEIHDKSQEAGGEPIVEPGSGGNSNDSESPDDGTGPNGEGNAGSGEPPAPPGGGSSENGTPGDGTNSGQTDEGGGGEGENEQTDQAARFTPLGNRLRR